MKARSASRSRCVPASRRRGPRRRRLVAARPCSRASNRAGPRLLRRFPRPWRGAPREAAARDRGLHASSTATCPRPVRCSIRARGRGQPRSPSSRRRPAVRSASSSSAASAAPRGRARARPRRLARSADARLRAARSLRALLRRCRDEKRRAELPRRWRLAACSARAGPPAAAARRDAAATEEILERETQDFLADVELFLDARSARRRRRHADRLRGVVRPSARGRRGAAGAGRAGRRSISAAA